MQSQAAFDSQTQYRSRICPVIIPKIKCASPKNKFWTKSLILCWSLTWEQFNNMLKTSTSLKAYKHNINKHYFNELKKKES